MTFDSKSMSKFNMACNAKQIKNVIHIWDTGCLWFVYYNACFEMPVNVKFKKAHYVVVFISSYICDGPIHLLTPFLFTS